ncbi:MAG: HAD family phosphatase [Gammaproteobacteria bacterium]|nr:HAD family phosphatase [Gammaproteobacteria bacterium]NNL49475.1 HAD family phosphatase [Woeseiaceae bacterium]
MNPTVLFDVGGVLADLGSPTGLMGLPYGDEQFWQAWTSSSNVRAYETGRMTEDQALPAISHDLGITDLGDFAQIFRRWRLRLYPDVERLVAKLPDDIELALLSNINPMHWQQLCDSTSIFDRFAHLFLSYERGIYKPDAAAFEYAIEVLGRDPGDILFLDDTKANVDAARRHGIDAHHVNDLESLKSRLSALL